MPVTLSARFQAQQWINDNAVDCASSIDFDAAPAVLSLNARQLRRFAEQAARTSGRDLDVIAEKAGLLEDHDGPYYVDIDTDNLTTFLAEVGLDDLDTVTDAKIDEARIANAASAPAP